MQPFKNKLFEVTSPSVNHVTLGGRFSQNGGWVVRGKVGVGERKGEGWGRKKRIWRGKAAETEKGQAFSRTGGVTKE